LAGLAPRSRNWPSAVRSAVGGTATATREAYYRALIPPAVDLIAEQVAAQIRPWAPCGPFFVNVGGSGRVEIPQERPQLRTPEGELRDAFGPPATPRDQILAFLALNPMVLAIAKKRGKTVKTRLARGGRRALDDAEEALAGGARPRRPDRQRGHEGLALGGLEPFDRDREDRLLLRARVLDRDVRQTKR
jgi:hypothetical protein